MGSEMCIRDRYPAFPQAFADAYNSNWGQYGPPVLVMLREPMTRTISSYNYGRMSNPLETAVSLEEAIDSELAGERTGLHPSARHVESSLIANAIHVWSNAGIPLRIAHFEQVVANPEIFVDAVARWAGIEQTYPLPHRNAGGGTWTSDSIRRLTQVPGVSNSLQLMRSTPLWNVLTSHLKPRLLRGTADEFIRDDQRDVLVKRFQADRSDVAALLESPTSGVEQIEVGERV